MVCCSCQVLKHSCASSGIHRLATCSAFVKLVHTFHWDCCPQSLICSVTVTQHHQWHGCGPSISTVDPYAGTPRTSREPSQKRAPGAACSSRASTLTTSRWAGGGSPRWRGPSPSSRSASTAGWVGRGASAICRADVGQTCHITSSWVLRECGGIHLLCSAAVQSRGKECTPLVLYCEPDTKDSTYASVIIQLEAVAAYCLTLGNIGSVRAAD
jgi:hypothetical protein